MNILRLIICLFCLLVIAPSKVFAGESLTSYFPTFQNPMWFYLELYPDGWAYKEVIYKKDTLVNDNIYKLLWYQYLPEPSSNIFVTGQGYAGAYREDKEQKQIIGLRYDNTEFVLYDYKLSIGDTFENQMVVEKIDSILLSDGQRKRFTFRHFASNIPTVWIEGIGNVSNFFSAFASETEYNYLVCFYQNGKQIYENPIREQMANCDTFWHYVNHFSVPPNPTLALYPNPVENELTITYSLPELGNTTFSIWNGLGQKMLERTETSDILAEKFHLSWDISSLPSGIYELRLGFNFKNVSTKFVKW